MEEESGKEEDELDVSDDEGHDWTEVESVSWEEIRGREREREREKREKKREKERRERGEERGGVIFFFIRKKKKKKKEKKRKKPEKLGMGIPSTRIKPKIRFKIQVIIPIKKRERE